MFTICLFCVVALTWVATWEKIGIHGNVGRFLLFVRMTINLLKNARFMRSFVSTDSWWLDKSSGRMLSPFDGIVMVILVHSAVANVKGGVALLRRGLGLRDKLRQWHVLNEVSCSNSKHPLYPSMVAAFGRARDDAFWDLAWGASEIIFGLTYVGFFFSLLGSIGTDTGMAVLLVFWLSFAPYLCVALRGCQLAAARVRACDDAGRVLARSGLKGGAADARAGRPPLDTVELLCELGEPRGGAFCRGRAVWRMQGGLWWAWM